MVRNILIYQIFTALSAVIGLALLAVSAIATHGATGRPSCRNYFDHRRCKIETAIKLTGMKTAIGASSMSILASLLQIGHAAIIFLHFRDRIQIKWWVNVHKFGAILTIVSFTLALHVQNILLAVFSCTDLLFCIVAPLCVYFLVDEEKAKIFVMQKDPTKY